MIEGLLKEQLRNDNEIAGMLAVYNGLPAIFYQKAPPDRDRLWEKPCYPRIDYNLDMHHDPEHKYGGTLTINVWCSSESKYMPEDIEKRLLNLIHGCFYSSQDESEHTCDYCEQPSISPETQITTCVTWMRSDAFAMQNSGRTWDSDEPEIFGITITFDVMEFPPQITTDPDPVAGLNAFTVLYFPDMTVIAGQKKLLPYVWRPRDEHPAIYWRYIGADSDNRQTYAVNWYNGQFAAHIFADTVLERNRWIKAIVEQIQIKGEVILPDGSPMFTRRIVIRHAADPEREGQILLTGRFGVLAQHRRETAQIPLNNAIYGNIGLEVRKDGTIFAAKIREDNI